LDKVLIVQPLIEEEGAFQLTCVTGNETAVCEMDASFQKAEDHVLLSISDTATRYGPTDDDARRIELSRLRGCCA
jgi:hypothetical protein